MLKKDLPQGQELKDAYEKIPSVEKEFFTAVYYDIQELDGEVAFDDGEPMTLEEYCVGTHLRFKDLNVEQNRRC